MTTAFVLSGGGSRGDFEVGALQYLYEQGVLPDIICGTSVGAINAAKLAEGYDPNDPNRGLLGLVNIWGTLRICSDMFNEEPWLNDPALDPRVRAVLLGTREELGIKAPGPHPEWGDLAWLPESLEGFAFLLGDGRALLQSLGVLVTAGALYNLNPIMNRFASNLDPSAVRGWATSGGRLRLGTVALESGNLRYVSEAGAVLERDGSTPVLDRGRVPAACTSNETALTAAEARVRSLQANLQSTPTGGKAAIVSLIRDAQDQLRVAQEALGACVSSQPPNPLNVSLATGALASASIPGIFPPVVMGDESYVDGGIREVLPLQVAVDLGADTIYIIEASPPGVPQEPPRKFSSGNVVGIVSRSLTEIAIDEISIGDAQISGPHAGTVTTYRIHPRTDASIPHGLREPVHDILTIDPGLIKISLDYGYMEAADIRARAAPAIRELALQITGIRRQIWGKENIRYGYADATQQRIYGDPPGPQSGPHGPGARRPDPAVQPELDSLKATLQGYVDQRRQLGGVLPASIDTWSGTLERHAWHVSRDSAQHIATTAPPDNSPPGAVVQAIVRMRNTGTTTWTTSNNYALGSQEPPDNTLWGMNRIAVPHDVPPGGYVDFAWNVTVPRSPQSRFAWQMLRDSRWFGDLTSTLVNIPEPAECQGLRTEIRDLVEEVHTLQSALQRLNGSSAADRQLIKLYSARLATAQAGLSTRRARASSVGCGAIP